MITGGMHRSTLSLAALSLLLAGGVTAVAWNIVATDTGGTLQPAIDSSLALGIPDVRPVSQDQIVPAHSAIVWNTTTDTIVFEQNAFERRPIASLTKLMTAMVALDHGIAWDHTTEIQPEEYVIGGQLLLHPGETVTMRDLFSASLLGSANNATLAYVRELGIDNREFIRAMNRKAVELGLEQTFFTDVTGLAKDTISTAYEVARMAEHAFAKYPDIATITRQAEYSFVVGGSGRQHTLRNTNKLVSDAGLTVTGSKTGYLDEAGYCLVLQGSGDDHDLIAVVLGSMEEEQQYQAIQYMLHSR